MLTAILAILPALTSPITLLAHQGSVKQEVNKVGPKPCTTEVQKLIDAAKAQRSQPEKACSLLHDAAETAKKGRDTQGVGLSYFAAAKIRWGSLNDRDALTEYGLALDAFRLTKDSAMLGTTLNNMGEILWNLSDPKAALDKFNESLYWHRLAHDIVGEATAILNIGQALFDLGDYAQAKQRMIESLPLWTQAKDPYGEAQALTAIANTQIELKDEKEAVKTLEHSLEIWRRLGNEMETAMALNSLGFILDRLGDKEGALNRYGEALPLLHTPSARQGKAVILSNMGGILLDLLQPKAAQEKYSEALLIQRQCGDIRGAATTLGNISSVWLAIGDRALATAAAKQSVTMLQDLRRKAAGLSDALKASYALTMAGTYRALYENLVEEGRFAEADRALAMLEGERIDATSRRDNATVDPLELTLKFTETEQKYVDAYEAKITALVERSNEADKLRRLEKRTPEEEAKLKELEKKEETARSEYFDWLKEATAEFKGYKPNQYEADKLGYNDGLSALSGRLTGQTGLKTAALTLIAYDDKTLAVLYLGGGAAPIAHLSDIKIGELNKRIKSVLDGCSSPDGDPQTESTKLLKDLLGPLLKAARDAKVGVLMTLLDGPVRWLPWQAMWDADAGKWLGEEFMLPRVTANSRDNLQLASSADWTIAAFGNDLNPDGKSHDIPSALEETLAIQSARGFSAQVRNNADFSLDSLKAAMKDKSVNVLHVASHFHLEPGSDKDSFLLLGDGSKFSVRDMRSVAPFANPDCELMVLSACQTAVSTGDGATIEGLAASTETKGPKAVIASLWKVNDTATKKLMVRFYGLRAEHKDWTKLQCLATAEKELRDGELGKPGEPGWRGIEPVGQPKASKWKGPGLHPYYWAPFVIFGNWK